MLFGDCTKGFVIELEQIFAGGSENNPIPLGTFNFVVGRTYYPAVGIRLNLIEIIEELRYKYTSGIKSIKYDLNKKKSNFTEKESLSTIPPEDRNKSLIDLSAQFLREHGFYCYLGFYGYREWVMMTDEDLTILDMTILPKGTLGDIIFSLPHKDDLIVEHIDNYQITNIKNKARIIKQGNNTIT